MSQPPANNRSFSFTNFQAINPTLPPPGSAIAAATNDRHDLRYQVVI
ncbi:hypothetical protein NK6_5656 [Bradyrhizobium diazoefficiens]|uniref:Uncharacterized protein n=1 Tax=Bradyrhizobium diazoefficiens TaxID=1355477 RepID=A0A0E4BRB8_9BRAD|nr:hypothetical protein NK6_5656 [Bradyrhizobium diazoefficiens]